MLVVKILLGLAGLGVIVFVHELGHFLAARLVGIDVEAFSIGWGKPILTKKVGGTEYRLGIFPVGGYCKMRGDNDFQNAYQNNLDAIPAEKGSFFSVKPVSRIIVAFAGPFFNLIFAVLVFSVIWGVGFEFTTMDNKIVLVSDIQHEESYPADKAGLKSGDKIIAINGKQIDNYRDIQSAIAVNAEKKLRITALRNGREFEVQAEPELDKNTGAGRLGVYFWADPLVDSVLPDSAASMAGIKSGDRITKINGVDFPYSVALYSILNEQPAVKSLQIELERDGKIINTELVLPAEDEDSRLGIVWQAVKYKTPRYSIFTAAAKGFSETYDTFIVSIRSLALLFKGIDLTQAVSGPVRITYMVGEIATESFTDSIGEGLRNIGNFLALISIALAVMNLLPLPVLDGGLIVLFIIEIIRRRPLHPRFISVFQTAGVVIIGGLMLFAVFGDIIFLVKR
ncbi:zinc metalloprotease [Spirochaetia bacterium]|nr:zinc metalloprotease [Spirochaetia bacterium]